MDKDFCFPHYDAALMAAQCMLFYFAHEGFQCHMSTYNGQYSNRCELVVFHEEEKILMAPAGYLYTIKKECEREHVYWTKFEFITQ